MVLLVAVLGVALYALVQYLRIERIGNLDVDAAGAGEARNYLVVGSDERESEDGGGIGGRRSDALMVVRVDPSGGEAATLSIPRDLVVPIAGTGETERINSAYGIDRATLLDTVREALDIELHHYVEVDFTAFEELVDALGGVDIWVDQALKDDRSGLFLEDLGCVTLDGDQALAFVRSRELQYLTDSGSWSAPDPSADLGRVERQQIFVTQALSEALSQVRANPARLPDLVEVGIGAVAIDDEMSVRQIVALGEALGDLDPSDLRTFPLPVVERGDGATLAIHEGEAGPVLDEFRDADSDGGDDGTATGDGTSVGDEEGANDGSGDDQSSAATARPTEFVFGEPPPGQSC